MASPIGSPSVTNSRSSSKKKPRALAPDLSNTENNSKLMNCLQLVHNQLNTKRGLTSDSSPTLQDQYLALSKAYDNSQEKILQLEECLMHETLLTEKQRSIIEILKQALDETMDDETVLEFLGELSREAPTNSDLSETILAIKNILEKHRLGTYLRKNKIQKMEHGLKEIEQRYQVLKQEFVKVDQMNRNYAKQFEKVIAKGKSEKEKEVEKLRQQYQAQARVRENKIEEIEKNSQQRVQKLQFQLQNSRGQSKSRAYQLQSLKQKIVQLQQESSKTSFKQSQQIQKQQQTIYELELKLKKLELNEQSLRSKFIEEMNERQRLTHMLSTINQTIQSLRGCSVSASRAPLSLVTYSSNLHNDIISLVSDKDKDIEKYKKKCQKLVQHRKMSMDNGPNLQILKTEVFIMKKFLSEEAIKLLNDYQQNPKQYLEKQIVELAKLQNDKKNYLQNCQKQLRRCKIKLMQLEQGGQIEQGHPSTTQRSKSRVLERTGKFSCSEFNI